MRTIPFTLPILAFVLTSASCAFNPEYANDKAAGRSDEALLNSYSDVRMLPNLSGARRNNYIAAEKEILKRGLARQSEIQNIRERKVSTGMTKNEVTLSWGKPSDINTTVGSGYYSEQWVYGGYSYAGSGGFRPMSFVYFNSAGRVTTIQN